MRAAPPVEAMLGTGRIERMLITLLHGLAGALLAVWAAMHAEMPVQAPVLGAGLALIGLMVFFGAALSRRAFPSMPRRLRWDGQAWSMVTGQRAERLRRLVVALDFGTWVLLRLHTDGRQARWCVASPASASAAWHALRVALAAHAGATGAGESLPP